MICYEINIPIPQAKRRLNWEKIIICVALWLASVYFAAHVILAALR